MKRILINATYEEEIRIAFIQDNWLYNLYIENTESNQKRLNIYKGKIIKIEPSLEAVFVNYNNNKNGFLPIKEISNEYFNKNISINSNNSIKDLICENQEILVQINKNERKGKCASLTTFISLAGSYLVLMPNNPNIIGISKRIDKTNKLKIKNILSKLEIPKNMGIIIRTAGLNKSIEELQKDLNLKLNHWNLIKKKFIKEKSPCIVYSENNLIIKIFRDYLDIDIDEIYIDNINILKLSKEYLKILGRDEFIKKIKLYNNNIPLFNKFNIEDQIETIFKKKVLLPSGGSIIIDTTEALTSIDINSSKNTKGCDIEETAFNTNMEAVKEIARQLRLRDLGGLIVIDFIDMLKNDHNKEIKRNLYQCIYKEDKAKVKIGNISKFGLLELSRQRINNPIKDYNCYICPRCEGIGLIRNNKSLSIHILRIIEYEIIKNYIKEIHVIVPISIGTYLLNEKRYIINNLENKNNGKTRIVIIPYDQIKTPNYIILKIKNNNDNIITSYLIPKIYEINNFNKNKDIFKNKFEKKNINYKYNLYKNNIFNKSNNNILYNNIKIFLIFILKKIKIYIVNLFKYF